jgi:recombination protein RecT
VSTDTKLDRPKFEVLAVQAKQHFITVVDEPTWNREFTFALQTMRNNAAIFEKVAQENPQSITNAIINIATIGTTLNPALRQAYLIPRSIQMNGQKRMSACLDHSYMGLCQIATSSGGCIDMDADVVYAGDYFKYIRGLNPTLEHIPFSMREDLTEEQRKAGKGEMVYVYATAILPFGNIMHTKFIVLDRAEVELVRKTSQAPNSPMWVNHYGEGARKTAIKKLYKLLPQTDRMSTAIAAINEFDGSDFAEQQRKKSMSSSLEERFGFQKESPVIDAQVETVDPDPDIQQVTSCEFCTPENGAHQSACPNAIQ